MKQVNERVRAPGLVAACAQAGFAPLAPAAQGAHPTRAAFSRPGNPGDEGTGTRDDRRPTPAMRPSSLRSLLAAAALALGGCSSTPALETTCRTGAECASGVCRADGSCEPATATDGGLTPSDAAPPIVTGDSGVCAPNADGRIERGEYPLAPGQRAVFAIARGVAVDLAGTTAGGVTTWNLKGPYAGDATRALDVQAPTGKWWSGAFPSAAYALALGGTADLVGVFGLSASELTLAGVVSPADGATKTQLAYDPAPAFLRFPLKKGDAWSTTSTVTGTASGLAIGPLTGTQYTETYAITADAEGFVEVPYGKFRAVRLLTTLTRRNQFGAAIPTLPDRRTVAFVAECFGTIATLTSNDNEANALFTNAAEVQRLAP
jgi:hypothetical protein